MVSAGIQGNGKEREGIRAGGHSQKDEEAGGGGETWIRTRR